MKIFIFKNKKSFFGEGAAYCNVLRKFTHILWLQKLPFFYLNIWRNCFFFFPRKKVIHPFSRLESVFESMMSEFIFLQYVLFYEKSFWKKNVYWRKKKCSEEKIIDLKMHFSPQEKAVILLKTSGYIVTKKSDYYQNDCIISSEQKCHNKRKKMVRFLLVLHNDKLQEQKSKQFWKSDCFINMSMRAKQMFSWTRLTPRLQLLEEAHKWELSAKQKSLMITNQIKMSAPARHAVW